MRKTIALLAAVTVVAPFARATNGYLSHGYGTKSKALGGAGSALAIDPMIAATNPAGVVDVGNSWEVGLAYFSPSRSYTVEGNPSGYPGTFGLMPGEVTSGKSSFFVPHGAYNRRIDDKSAWGLTVYGNGGMNTEWPSSANNGMGTFYGGAAGVNMEQLFVAATYSRQVAEGVSLGVAPLFAYQRFSATGLSQFAGFVADGEADNLTNNGTDTSTGFGLRLGARGKVAKGLTLAAAYQPEISMSAFSDYSDLFAQGGKFNIPSNLTLGLAYETCPAGVVVFDVQNIGYSGVPSIGNPFANLFQGMQTSDPDYLLGGDKGAGFGWDDVTAFKLGYQHILDEDWTVRGGASYCSQPIPSSEVLFNILAPGVEEWHFTGGASYRVSGNGEVNVALMYAPNVSVSGPNPMEAPNQQTIALEMSELELEVSYSAKF